MAAQEQTRRLFVGVPLPQGLLECAERVQSSLVSVPGIRLADLRQLHCTLAFIGAADSRVVDAAASVVAGLPQESGGEAFVEGLMLLPDVRRARVVALALDDADGVLERLRGALTVGLQAAGVMCKEQRGFRPHITVARIKPPGPVQPTSDCGRRVFGVESVCLYQSELRRDGAVHTVLVRRDIQRASGLKA